MRIFKNQVGAVPILLAMMLSIFLVAIAAMWQSRLLLSIYRTKSMADQLVLTYDAETKIYGMVSLYLHGYSAGFNMAGSETEVLPDGTVLEISSSQDGRDQSIVVLAKRQSGTTRLELVRGDLSSSADTLADTKILLILDCSTGMMDEQTEIAGKIMENIQNIDGGFNRFGISVFGLNSDWLYQSYESDGTPNGNAITPDTNLSTEEIVAAINTGLEGDDPIACRKLYTGANIGAGLKFGNDHMPAAPGPGRKVIEIMIADGEPDQRTENVSCPRSIFCPVDGVYCGIIAPCPEGSGAVCEPYGRDYLRCTLASEDDSWEPEAPEEDSPEEDLPGTRDQNISINVLTLADNLSDTAYDIYRKYASGLVMYSEAGDESTAADLMVQEMLGGSGGFEIKRVVLD